MKKLTILLLLITSSSVYSQQLSESFLWLEGKWNRTNNQPGKVTTESWQISDDKIIGLGVTTANGDTVFYENMSIVKVEKELHLLIDTPMNTEAVRFLITSNTKQSFVAENPENDFPKKITYDKTQKGIKATISGGGEAIDYLFVKAKE